MFKSVKVQRHAALVLGNVCQTDDHRATAGKEGAVEGLFVLCECKDDVVRANALWALGNLAWDLYNQVLRPFLPPRLRFTSSPGRPVGILAPG